MPFKYWVMIPSDPTWRPRWFSHSQLSSSFPDAIWEKEYGTISIAWVNRKNRRVLVKADCRETWQ